MWSLASPARTSAWARDGRPDGYFSPERYTLLEGSARVALGRDLGWGGDAELGLGNQAIAPFEGETASRFAQRLSAGLRYRPAPGMEYGASWWFANVASPSTVQAAEYRAWGASLAARLRL